MRNIDDYSGTINIHKQRLLLFRADNLTVNFVDFSTGIFKFSDKEKEGAQWFAQNILYQLGFGVGQYVFFFCLFRTFLNLDYRKSSRDFLGSRATILSAVVRSNIAFVQSAFMGLAFVELLPESILNGTEEDIIITRNRSSFGMYLNLFIYCCHVHS